MVHFDFAENNVKSVARGAATFIQFLCALGHNFALIRYFLPNLAYNLHIGWIILTKNKECTRTFLSETMKPVALLFDQSMYLVYGIQTYSEA